MIACADLHLTERVPICRRETPQQWIDHQKKILQFISSLNQDIVIAGDIFDRPIVSIPIVELFIDFVRSHLIHGRNVYIMKGNHDIPERDYDAEGTAYSLVYKALHDKKGFMDMTDYNETNTIIALPYKDLPLMPSSIKSDYLCIHVQCYDSEKAAGMVPRDKFITAKELLNLYPNVRTIITGDMHKPFLYVDGSRAVVNCGCVSKQKVDTKDDKLCVWQIGDDILPIMLPHDDGVFNDHIVIKNEKENRAIAVVESIKNMDTDISADFELNIKKALTILPDRDSVGKKAKQYMEVV